MHNEVGRAPRRLRLGKFALLCRPWNTARLLGRGAYWTSGGGVPSQQEKVLESYNVWPFELTWPASS